MTRLDSVRTWAHRNDERVAATGGAMAAMFTMATQPVAAQSMLDVACGTILGDLFSLVLSAVALYLVVAGIVYMLLGADEAKSSSGSMKKSGADKKTRGMKMFVVGLAGPPVIGAILASLGVGLECFAPGDVALFILP